MLAHVLALMVGFGSFALYMAAFFFPEIHRKNDFIWSGIGLFYALVLWVCAGRITGGVLLGQMAGVTLLGWLAWQTVLLRRQSVPLEQQTALPSAEDVQATLSNLTSPEGRTQLAGQATRLFSQVKEGVQGAIATATPKPQTPTPEETYTPPNLEEFGTAGQEAIERFAKAALPEEKMLAPERNPIPEQTNETGQTDTTEQGPEREELVNEPSKPPKATPQPDVLASPSPQTVSQPVAVPPQSTTVVQVIAETVQSLLKSFARKKETKPVYVRKQYRDGEPETETTVSKATTTKKAKAAPKKESKPVYVRKQYREDEPATGTSKKQNKSPYVRKQYRQEEPATEPPVTEATVISVIETLERTSDGSLVADTAIEIVSDDIAPDLLAGALADATLEETDATVEEFVEELLEEISVQEEAVEKEAISAEQATETTLAIQEPIPPRPPSPELVEAAISDAEEKGISYDPPEIEEESNW